MAYVADSDTFVEIVQQLNDFFKSNVQDRTEEVKSVGEVKVVSTTSSIPLPPIPSIENLVPGRADRSTNWRRG